jgi:hypothetical protein
MQTDNNCTFFIIQDMAVWDAPKIWLRLLFAIRQEDSLYEILPYKTDLYQSLWIIHLWDTLLMVRDISKRISFGMRNQKIAAI